MAGGTAKRPARRRAGSSGGRGAVSRRAEGTERYYQYSAAAYDLNGAFAEPATDADYAGLPAEAPIKAPRRKRRKLTPKERSKRIRERVSPKYIFVTNDARKLSLSTIITVAMVFAGICAYLISLGLCSVGSSAVAAMEAEAKRISDGNLAVSSLAVESYDLQRVQDVATRKLGMVKPADHQLVYIKAPKENYFVQY
jgi:hypothetical protein